MHRVTWECRRAILRALKLSKKTEDGGAMWLKCSILVRTWSVNFYSIFCVISHYMAKDQLSLIDFNIMFKTLQLHKRRSWNIFCGLTQGLKLSKRQKISTWFKMFWMTNLWWNDSFKSEYRLELFSREKIDKISH